MGGIYIVHKRGGLETTRNRVNRGSETPARQRVVFLFNLCCVVSLSAESVFKSIPIWFWPAKGE